MRKSDEEYKFISDEKKKNSSLKGFKSSYTLKKRKTEIDSISRPIEKRFSSKLVIK